jgi:hypothetical protein
MLVASTYIPVSALNTLTCHMSTKQDPVMVMLLEFPSTKGLVGDTAVMCGGHRSDASQSCAWQNDGGISNNSVKA